MLLPGGVLGFSAGEVATMLDGTRTSAKGIYGPAVAEHALALILAAARGLLLLYISWKSVSIILSSVSCTSLSLFSLFHAFSLLSFLFLHSSNGGMAAV